MLLVENSALHHIILRNQHQHVFQMDQLTGLVLRNRFQMFAESPFRHRPMRHQGGAEAASGGGLLLRPAVGRQGWGIRRHTTHEATPFQAPVLASDLV